MIDAKTRFSFVKIYRKFFIKSPGGGGLIISSPFETGGLFERGGGLFNKEKTTVSVLHKKTRKQSA